MNRIAVLILTYNEESNIEDCIKSASFADEVIIIDSGSVDRTEEISRQLGAKFIYHSFSGFAAQRNFALTQTNAEWVFYLDADERITPEAAEEIRKIVAQEPIAAYQILRTNVIFGQPVKYGGHSPDLSLRLYPRTSVHWEGKVHEHAEVNVPIRKMNAFMLHYTYQSWDRYFFKFDQYTTILAEEMYQRGKKMKLTDILIRPWYAFLRFYILKSGWRDGMTGLIFALLHAFYTMTKYIKLYYLGKEGSSK
jgi:glycosyltransferase involved in cell wall biosynthesis